MMLTDFATWAQILSALAVLGTLVYLGIETRQNTEAVRAALIAFMAHMEYTWLQHKNNAAEADLWETQRGIVQIMLGTKRSRNWWKQVGRYGNGTDFVEEVDSAIENQPYTTYFEGVLRWGAETFE